jgi:uncharacterized ferritin-like protein (DUF455 family)
MRAAHFTCLAQDSSAQINHQAKDMEIRERRWDNQDAGRNDLGQARQGRQLPLERRGLNVRPAFDAFVRRANAPQRLCAVRGASLKALA